MRAKRRVDTVLLHRIAYGIKLDTDPADRGVGQQQVCVSSERSLWPEGAGHSRCAQNTEEISTVSHGAEDWSVDRPS